ARRRQSPAQGLRAEAASAQRGLSITPVRAAARPRHDRLPRARAQDQSVAELIWREGRLNAQAGPSMAASSAPAAKGLRKRMARPAMSICETDRLLQCRSPLMALLGRPEMSAQRPLWRANRTSGERRRRAPRIRRGWALRPRRVSWAARSP